MIVNRIVNLKPLLRFISSICLLDSVVTNQIGCRQKLAGSSRRNAICLVQREIWDMVMSPWEYGLNADGIMKCYGLYKRLSEVRMGE